MMRNLASQIYESMPSIYQTSMDIIEIIADFLVKNQVYEALSIIQTTWPSFTSEQIEEIFQMLIDESENIQTELSTLTDANRSTWHLYTKILNTLASMKEKLNETQKKEVIVILEHTLIKFKLDKFNDLDSYKQLRNMISKMIIKLSSYEKCNEQIAKIQAAYSNGKPDNIFELIIYLQEENKLNQKQITEILDKMIENLVSPSNLFKQAFQALMPYINLQQINKFYNQIMNLPDDKKRWHLNMLFYKLIKNQFFNSKQIPSAFEVIVTSTEINKFHQIKKALLALIPQLDMNEIKIDLNQLISELIKKGGVECAELSFIILAELSSKLNQQQITFTVEQLIGLPLNETTSQLIIPVFQALLFNDNISHEQAEKVFAMLTDRLNNQTVKPEIINDLLLNLILLNKPDYHELINQLLLNENIDKQQVNYKLLEQVQEWVNNINRISSPAQLSSAFNFYTLSCELENCFGAQP